MSTPQLADVSVLWTPVWPLSGSQADPILLRTETRLFYLAGQKGTGLKQFIFQSLKDVHRTQVQCKAKV